MERNDQAVQVEQQQTASEMRATNMKTTGGVS